MHLIQDAGEPLASNISAAKSEELVTPGQCGRTCQQDVLDIVEFEHVGSLHLVEHVRERGLQRQSLLDLLGADKRILAVFQETRALVLANELDESRRIRL